MQNDKIDLYSIVCEYNEEERKISDTSDEYARKQRITHYTHNYENSLDMIGINPELQKELRNEKKHMFENTTHIKSTVALLCLPIKDYNSKIEFKNYSVEDIRNNMSLILKQNFKNVDINFISSLYRKIKILIKSISNNEITTNRVLDTINSTINLSELKRITLLQRIVKENLSYEKLYASDNGLLSEEDKLIYLNLIQFCLKNTFKFAYHLQEYMSATRQEELLENLSDYDDDDDDDGPTIYSPNMWLPLYSNRIKDLPNEKQKIIENIYFKENKKYINMCKDKKSSSRKQSFTIIKNEVEEQLKQEKIDIDIIKNLISDLRYCDSTKQTCDEKRYLWQKIPSKELIMDAINNFKKDNSFFNLDNILNILPNIIDI